MKNDKSKENLKMFPSENQQEKKGGISKQSQRSTEKKIESNRKNAQKSTGPRTQAGKEVVSQNARTHGLLSRNLVIEGESQKEFFELLNLLREEYQPVGITENVLVESVAITIWRKHRLVNAESAKVRINRQSFGPDQIKEVTNALNLEYDDYNGSIFKGPNYQYEHDKVNINDIWAEQELWKAIVTSDIVHGENTFDHLPKIIQEKLLERLNVDASQIDFFVKDKYGSWPGMFEHFIKTCNFIINYHRFIEMSRLVTKSQTIPSQTDLLTRYGTALDNDLYKALKALREAQSWRESKKLITAMPVVQSDDGKE